MVHLGSETYFDLGEIEEAHILLVQSEMGSTGPGGSILTVTHSIQALSPSAVLMVGIAFGMDAEKQQVGQVLVAQQIRDYEVQKIGTSARGRMKIIARGPRVDASTRLIKMLKAASHDWCEPGLIDFGLLLSGAKLIDNPRFRDELRAIEPEALGGEMEGAGVYAAAYRDHVDWIVVKAICDWANGHKGEHKKERQGHAAKNAADFAFHVLGKGGFGRGRRLDDGPSDGGARAMAREVARRDHLTQLKDDIIRPITDRAAAYAQHIARHGVFADGYVANGGYSGALRPAIPADHPLALDWPAHFPAFATRARAFDDAVDRYQEEGLGLLNAVHARLVTHNGEQSWVPILDGAILAWLLGLSGQARPVERMDMGFGRTGLYVSDPGGGADIIERGWQGVEHDVSQIERDEEIGAHGWRLRSGMRDVQDRAAAIIRDAEQIHAQQYLTGDCTFVESTDGGHSGPSVDARMEVGKVAGDAAAVRARRVAGGHVVGVARADTVEESGRLAGVDVDSIGDG